MPQFGSSMPSSGSIPNRSSMRDHPAWEQPTIDVTMTALQSSHQESRLEPYTVPLTGEARDRILPVSRTRCGDRRALSAWRGLCSTYLFRRCSVAQTSFKAMENPMPYLDLDDDDGLIHLWQLFLAAHPAYRESNDAMREVGKRAWRVFRLRSWRRPLPPASVRHKNTSRSKDQEVQWL